jgi:hypothetical protein
VNVEDIESIDELCSDDDDVIIENEKLEMH